MPAPEPLDEVIVDFDYEGDVTATTSIVVDEGCVLRGGAFAPFVRISGRISGAVHADRFEIGQQGEATGDVRVGIAKVQGRSIGLLVAGRLLVCDGARIEGQVVADEIGVELGAEMRAVTHVHPGASADAELIDRARQTLQRPRAAAVPAPVTPVAVPVAAAPVPVAAAPERPLPAAVPPRAAPVTVRPPAPAAVPVPAPAPAPVPAFAPVVPVAAAPAERAPAPRFQPVGAAEPVRAAEAPPPRPVPERGAPAAAAVPSRERPPAPKAVPRAERQAEVPGRLRVPYLID